MDERMIDTSSLLRHRGWGAAAAAGEFAEVSRSIAWEFVVAVGGVVDSCPMNLCLCLSLRALSPPPLLHRRFFSSRKTLQHYKFQFQIQVASLLHHEHISIIFFTLCLSSFNCFTVDFFCFQFKTKEEGWWQTRILLQARQQSRQESE
jgi:hypothetical protein